MSHKTKKMLLVTYVFPPNAAVGVFRILKFCKYLPEFGITPVIMMPTNPSMSRRDEKLIHQVPPGIPVYTSPNLEPWRNNNSVESKPTGQVPTPSQIEPASPSKPSLVTWLKKFLRRNLTIPDQRYLWTWTGLLKGIQLIRKERIDLILSSSPPSSVHLLASRISHFSGIPHLLDFRDLWTQNTSYNERQRSKLQIWRDRTFEKKVLKQCAGISVNTCTFKKQLMENNPFLSNEQIEVVTNGVDPDDFIDLVGIARRNDKFTMVYTGSLYGRHRDPEFFLAAVRQWLDNDSSLNDQLEIVFLGNWDYRFEGLPAKYRLENLVRHIKWLPQRDALEATFGADLLLLFQGLDPVLSSAIPRKLYEYMITNKSILAFAPPGEVPDIINRYQCGVTLSDSQPERIIQFLDHMYQKWKTGRGSVELKKTALRSMPELETRNQVKKLAELCHRLL